MKIKDLCLFMVKITSTEFICPRHGKKCGLENAWITSALNLVLCRLELEFFYARADASNATLEVLIVGHYLEK